MNRSGLIKVGLLALLFSTGYAILLATHGPLRQILLRWTEDLEGTRVRDIEVLAPPGFAGVHEAGQVLSEHIGVLMSVYGVRWGLRRPEGLRLVLLRNREDFLSFGFSETLQQLEANDGYFNPRKNQIVLIARDMERLGPALVHEATHAVLHTTVELGGGTSLPQWLHEGLAEYFERGPRARPRLPVVLKPSAILSAPPERFRSEGNHSYYAGSHALVWFLLNRTEEGDDSMYGALRFGRNWDQDPIGTFRRAFGIDVGDLDRRWAKVLEE